MKSINVKFVDFWPDFDLNHNIFIDRLKLYYNINISNNPDYLFYSSFGKRHLDYSNSVKIYFTGENDIPNFNECDYALAFQHISFEDRYLRFPLYLLYGDLYDRAQIKDIDNEQFLRRKFCNFVYSNSKNADPFREKFYRELSKYKKIDSGGRYLNNIGGPVKNKLDFIKDYKFTIAFENSSLSGYTTEKILEPMSVGSLPIYWGNPNVSMDFNSNSFININEFSSIEKAIDEIIRIDKDDDLYIEMLRQPCLVESRSLDQWFSLLDAFLCNIFDQSKSKAKRCTEYGFVRRRLSNTLFSSIINKLKY